jgi:hypothetical protein
VLTSYRAQIGASAVDGYLSGPAVTAELVQRMKALAQEDFVSFVEVSCVSP